MVQDVVSPGPSSSGSLLELVATIKELVLEGMVEGRSKLREIEVEVESEKEREN